MRLVGVTALALGTPSVDVEARPSRQEVVTHLLRTGRDELEALAGREVPHLRVVEGEGEAAETAGGAAHAAAKIGAVRTPRAVDTGRHCLLGVKALGVQHLGSTWSEGQTLKGLHEKEAQASLLQGGRSLNSRNGIGWGA